MGRALNAESLDFDWAFCYTKATGYILDRSLAIHYNALPSHP